MTGRLTLVPDAFRRRHLAAGTPGFLCAGKVTGARTSDRTAGRAVLAEAVSRHRDLAPAWVDGGYANTVDRSLIAWAKENTVIEVVVVKRADDAKGSRILPRRRVIERANAWISAHRRLTREFERLVE